MNAKGNEIRVVIGENKKAFEEQVEILLEQGFVFFPESFKVNINHKEGIRNFAIMMFRKGVRE
jgi:hypothetical protein